MVKAVVGANWGDEGKGKITDMLAKQADIIVRFQGGANAGHTIVPSFVTFAESNAKALLTAVPSIKSCLCALPGAFLSYGRSDCSRRFSSAAVSSISPKISLSAAILQASLS